MEGHTCWLLGYGCIFCFSSGWRSILVIIHRVLVFQTQRLCPTRVFLESTKLLVTQGAIGRSVEVWKVEANLELLRTWPQESLAYIRQPNSNHVIAPSPRSLSWVLTYPNPSCVRWLLTQPGNDISYCSDTGSRPPFTQWIYIENKLKTIK